jgi:chaperonin cofactor prefoldin
MRVEDKGSSIIIEDLSGYLSRKFDEIEKRFATIEEQEEQQNQALEKIKSAVNEIYKQTLKSGGLEAKGER